MLPSLKLQKFTLSNLQRKFELGLDSIWHQRGSKRQLGLAISGGVDSMALASLCSKTFGSDTDPPSIRGFIVDHGLRQNSAEEAQCVSRELERLRIVPQILTLDWEPYHDLTSLRNMESTARKLRYRALGTACRAHGITSLLLGHHKDDQAETVMLRMLTGYFGSGLQGIKFKARIPECEGIHGVRDSGGSLSHTDGNGTASVDESASMLVEQGVTIIRPLLSFGKDQLIAVCREAGTKWFEDHTNADSGLTLRNTIRYLQTQQVLPTALQGPRLCSLAANIRAREEEIDHVAEQAFSKVAVRLDLRNGSAACSFEPAFASLALAGDNAYHAACRLTRRAISLVAPTDNIPLQDLHDAVDLVLSRSIGYDGQQVEFSVSDVVNVAGVHIRKDTDGAGKPTVTVHRGQPNSRDVRNIRLAIHVSHDGELLSSQSVRQSEWRLWDNRYWIRICGPQRAAQGVRNVIVRFLTKDDIAALRSTMDRNARESLERALCAAPGNLRFTLPAIAVRQVGREGRNDADEQVVVLPSIGWSAYGWQRARAAPSDSDGWSWDIRYKHVDFEESTTHHLVPVLRGGLEVFQPMQLKI